MAKNEYQFGQARTSGPARGPIRIAEKPKDMRGSVRMLSRYLKNQRLPLCAAWACAVASVLLTLFAPNGLNRITTCIEQGMASGNLDTGTLVSISIRVLLIYLFSSLLIYTQSVTLVHTTQNIMYSMRGDIDRKLNRIPLSRFDSASFGDLLSRVTNDVDTIGMSLNHSATEIVTAVVTFLGVAVMMFVTNIKLALISLASCMIGFQLMRLIVRKSQRHFVNRQKYLGELNGHIEEVYAGHLIVKAYGGEETAKQEFSRLNNLLFEANWKSQFLSGVMRPIMDFLGNFGYVAVCVAGAVMAISGEIGFGTIVEFILYVKMFTMPMGMVAQSVTGMQSAVAAAERVFSFLNGEELEDESGKTPLLTDTRGSVVFDHVCFGYTPGQTVIHDFCASVRPGQKVAIVGPTGAGKTTLVNLLMRFYEVRSGRILLDGKDIRETTRENIHDQFCMVLQDTWLFRGTVRENIVFSRTDITNEQVIAACKAVNIHRFIRSLPDGYDTVLTDSSNLSAGQRQLITIARALVNNAPLLILDEATSSVDTRTEQQVQNAMDTLTKNRTSFTIAHRLSTIRNADIILVMKDGDVVETGTHRELLSRGGFYADLWNSQFVSGEAI